MEHIIDGKNGHEWKYIGLGRCVQPFICSVCGALSGSDAALRKCGTKEEVLVERVKEVLRGAQVEQKITYDADGPYSDKDKDFHKRVKPPGEFHVDEILKRLEDIESRIRLIENDLWGDND